MSVECAICLETLKRDASKLPCGHPFHTECIQNLRKKECPLCKRPFTRQEVEEIDNEEIRSVAQYTGPKTATELFNLNRSRIEDGEYLGRPLSATPGYNYLTESEKKKFEELAKKGGKRRKTLRRRRSTRKTRNVRK